MTRAMPQNPFKAALKQCKPQVGLWSSLSSPLSAELLAGAGFDWLLFDTEHSPIEISGVLPLLQAAAPYDTHPVVRVAWNDAVLIKRALDIGAQSILIPFVQNPQEAKNAVAACKYPPLGIRGVAGSTRASGFGRIKNYAHKANDEVCVCIQLETLEALSHIDEIAKTRGLDGVFIGPGDLAASMGHLGNPAHAEVQAVIEKAAETLKGHGLASGILATNPEDANRYLALGFTFVAANVDTILLATAADTLRKSLTI